MADAHISPGGISRDRLSRWAGSAVLGGSLIFVGDRLWRLDWATFQDHLSWSFVGAVGVACLMFAAADRALAGGWAKLADPDRTIPPHDMARIYGRGVLMKYLPGSVFQYVSRHVGGKRAGLSHADLARSSIAEVGLHVAGSLTVTAACLGFERWPLLAAGGLMFGAMACFFSRRPIMTVLALQIVAFGGFALAAGLMGMTILSGDIEPGRFAALFLLAWLAGFVVPVAPGGFGVREAVLIATIGSAPAAAVLAAALALRVSSIGGDVLYGLTALIGYGAMRPRSEVLEDRAT